MDTLNFAATKSSAGCAIIEASVGKSVVFRGQVNLLSADDRLRCAEEVHQEVPAVTVDAINRELLAIDPGDLSEAIPGPDDPWPEPVSVEAPPVPEFPVHVLPEPLRAWVTETAEATQTPPDLAGMLALGACSGTMAKRTNICAGLGWTEPINVYVVSLLEPASRKSAVFKMAVAPLKEIEDELKGSVGPEVARAASERRVKEIELKKAEQKAGGGAEDYLKARNEASRLAEELSQTPIPVVPQLQTDDSTAEALEVLLANQGGRMIVSGAEGGVFDIIGGRYSSGGGNMDIFLKGHAGDDLRVNRVSRGSLFIPDCCLTLIYAIQPEVIRRLGKDPSCRGKGLFGRFLYAYPRNLLGTRRSDPEPVTATTTASYRSLIRRLYDAGEAAAVQATPPLLELTPEAFAEMRQFREEIELALGDAGELESMRDWGGKLPGLAARLAGVLHLVANDRTEPWLDKVELSTMQAAIELARYAIPHAKAVFRLMTDGSGSLDDASYVLKRLRDHGRPELTRRDVHELGRARFDHQSERLDDVLKTLVEHGWLRAIENNRSTGPGRKPSQRFTCHPSLIGNCKPGRHIPIVNQWVAPPDHSERVKEVI